MIKKIAFLEAEVKHLSAQTKKQSDDYALLLTKFNELTQAKAAIDQRGTFVAVYLGNIRLSLTFSSFCYTPQPLDYSERFGSDF